LSPPGAHVTGLAACHRTLSQARKLHVGERECKAPVCTRTALPSHSPSLNHFAQIRLLAWTAKEKSPWPPWLRLLAAILRVQPTSRLKRSATVTKTFSFVRRSS